MSFKKVKFLHFFLHDGLGFVSKYTEMINTQSDFFDPAEHAFLTNQPRIYEQLKHFGNVFFAEDCNCINKYGEYGDWLFIHALNLSYSQLFSIKKRYAKKIIWRTWGHDFKILEYKANKLKNIVKFVLNYLFCKKVGQFYAVGCANQIDILRAQRYFKNIKTFLIHYSFIKDQKETLEGIEKKAIKHDTVRILVGHSGCRTDNHIEILKNLAVYKDDNITVVLVLSYGEKDYINNVITFAQKTFGDKVEIINEHMPYFDYAKFISEIDVAVMDQTHSAALGNLRLLTFFKKKIYINVNSDFARALKKNECIIFPATDIGKISFDAFVESDDAELSKIKQLFGRVLTAGEFCEINQSVFNHLKNL